MKTLIFTLFTIFPIFLKAGDNLSEDITHQSMDMSPLFFIIIALFIGINTKRFLRKIPIPYTVILLLIGIGIGLVNRLEWVHDFHLLSNAIDWAGHIDSKIILYVFLPTLIFEAAFDLDVHTFKKSFWNAFLMAVPGIAIAIFITLLMVLGIKHLGIGFENWDWKIAAMFGAVICATDPVAVVSLLKELGGGKKLRTLIESESLLNDGTAIVIFMVFFTIITGTAIDDNFSHPILDFLIVTLGGVAIGTGIGYFTLFLLKKVFNDPLFEITGIIGSAYLTFFIAESFHLSGVIALVTLGLLMAGRGKTRISPEVSHFMHDFWGLFAFIANTLIFIIVGVIISLRSKFQLHDFIDLGLIYIGIHIIRAFVIFIFYPIMKKIGYGINRKEATVLWWGGLRGVIGLAMALIVVEYKMTDSELQFLANSLGIDFQNNPLFFDAIKEQFLFITAGIVLLTSLINATTIKALVNGLGLTKIPYGRSVIIAHAVDNLRTNSEERITLLKKDRFMSGANWESVEKFLPKLWSKNDSDLSKNSSEGSLSQLRTVLLNKEKKSYWNQFSDGLLGRKAYNQLTKITNEFLDAGGEASLADSKYIDDLWNTSKFYGKIQLWSLFQKTPHKEIFSKVKSSYDAAKGFIKAQEQVLSLVNEFNSDSNNTEEEIKFLKMIKDEVNEKKIQGLTFLRNLKNAFPEVYKSIETNQASRATLNSQKSDITNMLRMGRLDEDDAVLLLSKIELQMQEVLNHPFDFTLPSVSELVKEVSWLKDLGNKELKDFIQLTDVKIFPLNFEFIKEMNLNNDLGIIARGGAKYFSEGDDGEPTFLKQGDVISKFTHSLSDSSKIISITPLTVIWIKENKIDRIKELSSGLKESLQST